MLTLAQTPEHPAAAAAAGPREEQVFPPRLFFVFCFLFSFSLFTPRRLRSSAGKNVVTVDNSSSTGRVVSESEMTRVYQKGKPRNRKEEDFCHLRFSLEINMLYKE